MNADIYSYAALGCFGLGAVAAIASFKLDSFKHPGWQIVFAGTGALLKTVSIGMACRFNQSHFFNSTSEIYGLLAWSLALSYLLALLVTGVRSLGALVLPLIVALMALSIFSGTEQTHLKLPPGAIPLFAAHILSAFLGYGLFLTACGASLLYLEQARFLKRKTFGVLFQDLPSLEKLERLEILCSRLGLLAFTVALGGGAWLAQQTHNPFWFEWKFMAAQITWLVFGALVLGRALRWLSGRTAAKFVLAGAALVVLTLALGHPLGTGTTGARVQGSGFRVREALRNEMHVRTTDIICISHPKPVLAPEGSRL